MTVLFVTSSVLEVTSSAVHVIDATLVEPELKIVLAARVQNLGCNPVLLDVPVLNEHDAYVPNLFDHLGF
jgi:hypothetical protein